MLTDINIKFTNMIEKIIKDMFQRAEAELKKAIYYKEMLELPSKKENWNIQENAEDKMMEHTKNTLTLMGEVDVLMDGLRVFQDGLIYRLTKETGIVRKTVKVE